MKLIINNKVENITNIRITIHNTNGRFCRIKVPEMLSSYIGQTLQVVAEDKRYHITGPFQVTHVSSVDGTILESLGEVKETISTLGP